MTGWTVALVAILYLIAQYVRVKTIGRRNRLDRRGDRPLIYALSLASGGSSWLFYGALGYAAENGVEFIGLFIGIALAFTLGFPFFHRVIKLAQSQGIASIADLIGARYGKSFSVTAFVTIITTIGGVPYLALQLTAVHYLFEVFAGSPAPHSADRAYEPHWLVWGLLCVIALFIIHNSEKSPQTMDRDESIVRTLASDSAFKMIVFIAVGIAATTFLFGTPDVLFDHLTGSGIAIPALHAPVSLANIVALALIGAATTLLFPSQFYLTVVENRSRRELSAARWLVPACLSIAGFLVLPLAAIGTWKLPHNASPDFYFLSLPLQAHQGWLAILAFAGGLSAAATMLVLPTIVLSIMISNDLILPILLNWPWRTTPPGKDDYTAIIPKIRRYSIVAILLAAYAYQFTIRDYVDFSELSLISAVSMMQMLPPFLGGFVWRRATARGAWWGMAAGTAVWFYTMLLPTWLDKSCSLVTGGPYGIGLLRPHHLWGLDASPVVNGLLWSLTANLAFFILGSLSKSAAPLERIQANIFIPETGEAALSSRNHHANVTVDQLKDTISRYIGAEQTRLAFDAFQGQQGIVPDGSADFKTVHFSEQLLSSIVGSPSARLILSLAMGPSGTAQRQTQILLEHATEALVQNRDLLQTALDRVDQGIGVFDRQFRLMCWNRPFPLMLDLPAPLQRMGTPFHAIVSFLLPARDAAASGDHIALKELEALPARWRIMLGHSGRTVDILANAIPDGGMVATFTDVTQAVETDRMLRQGNERLDARVRERTKALTLANQELAKARRRAEDANISKTRFLADAGHDILQPLNAARLYASALTEQLAKPQLKELAANLNSSLEAVESIFNALLDISRLDAGALRPEISTIPLNTVLLQVFHDFLPVAQERALEFKLVESSVAVATDPHLLRRLLQNLVSNAIKYCKSGKILMGVRRRGDTVEVQVLDTGIGIAKTELNIIFREFSRLSHGMRESDGLGLGLSIVERIATLLGMTIRVSSSIGKGSVFSIRMPVCSTAVSNPPALERHGTLDGLSVLCIDDDERSLAGMKELLQTWGCTVNVLTHGKTLLALRDSLGEPPDVILADYNLGDENGMDLIAELRSQYGCRIQAALVTADRSSQLRDRAAAEDIPLINKPVRPAVLRSLLSHLQGTRADA
ncbi:hybrid sensor histidine kinase/response regulator [Phyllobacterium myrsinacearum]|uniref:histidine kinase n=1 Tax=Phyllobacterium myrsinacearum TaxID=28101 RepID=A0A2S9JCB7_9HYPH|nr:hybrid sensor histidine kinase/response regulator [Phyllobacterium myrsinacearum]PRD50470.1 hybrid sensor histidine kinase/response regulator [Phyllobacterium myrsinacearum]PWV94999.1 signal transduction histidine kinase [Phyllobacterium myrsinacearum]RZV06890.1 signal transduction histidine kinase [Phyllobacterium myrsinacearum]